MTDSIELLHYYLISFSFTDEYRKENGSASVQIGWPDQNITKDRIDEARRSACPSTKSTVLAVSYLGHMTRQFFRGEP